MATELAVYGWDDNCVHCVLIIHDDGLISVWDCLADEYIAGQHAELDYARSIPEALEIIERHTGWDDGGDVNVMGVYYDFGGHDYSRKRDAE